MKPFRVVCVKNFPFHELVIIHPIKGEIYEPTAVKSSQGTEYYKIHGLQKNVWYCSEYFRLTDSTYGEAVCEQIEQIIELEETISI